MQAQPKEKQPRVSSIAKLVHKIQGKKKKKDKSKRQQQEEQQDEKGGPVEVSIESTCSGSSSDATPSSVLSVPLLKTKKKNVNKKKDDTRQQQQEDVVTVDVPVESTSSEATPITLLKKKQKAKQKKKDTEQQQLEQEQQQENVVTADVPIESSAPLDDQATIKKYDFQDIKPHGNEKDCKRFDKTLEVLEQVFGIAKDVSEATPMLGPLKGTCGVIIRGIQMTRGAHSNRIAWSELCEDLQPQAMDLVKHLNNIKEGRMAVHSSFSNALEHYLDIIKEVFEKASKPASDDDSEWLLKIKKAATHQTQKEEIARYRERLKYAWQRYNDSLIFDMHKKVTDVGVHVKEMQKNLARGRRTNRAPDNYGAGTQNYKNAHKDNIERCQDGTRTHELDVIRQWAAEPTSPQQIFWLNDAAGTGKTAIAATMDGEWQMSGYLASRFCFSASVNSEEPLKDLCFGLARGLVGCQPKIRDLVSDMLDDGSDDHYSYFDVCFKRLILEPLQDPRAPRPAVLVIDGLDHGTTKQQRKELLNALIRLLPSAKHVKVLLTSLPLQDIREHLVDSPLVCGSDMQLLDVHATSHPDITTYVDSQLSKYSKRGKITPEHRKMIVAKSDGLFLYAATVCRMLASDRLGRLQMLSASTAPPDIEKKMDELYMSVLDQVEIGRGEDQSIMDVLSTIVVAFQPISIDTISTFVPSIDEMEDIVGDLSGVLQISKSTHFVKIIHPTFRDFLLSNRERANSYFVDAASSHARMAIACLKTLDPVLGDDLFHVKEAGERPLRNQDITNVDELLDQRTTAAVRYASAYWAHHVAASEVSSALWKVILQFLDQKLLNWIELMSWRSCIPICIEGLARLYTKARMCHNKNPNVVDSRNLLIIRHAYQFAVYHQTLLTESALQVYSMALAFTPPNSPLFEVYRQQYKEHLPNITTSHVTEWGNQMMLKGHSGILRQILFSPTGPHLASLGEDGTLRIWNTETGGLAKEFSGEGEQDGSISDLIAHCAFSPDGQLLAFATTSNQLHIRSCSDWEPVLPSIHREKVSRDPSNVRIAFSPSKSQIIFSQGGSVSQLDWEAGKEVRTFEIFKGDYNIVDLAISGDGCKLVCVGAPQSTTKKSRVSLTKLDPKDNVTEYEIDGITPSFSGSCIAFSADSMQFATWSDSRSVQLRDAVSGEEINTLEGCKSAVFCPQNKYLASSSGEFTVTISDQKTGKAISTLRGHKARILATSFSSDGTKLATVSTDQTVRVWSVPTGQSLATIFPGYTGDILHAILSPDWKRFVSAGDPCRYLSLYDLQTGDAGCNILACKPRAYTTATSPTSIYVARGDDLGPEGKGGIQLWDMASGKSLVIKGSHHNIIGLAFSPNGKLVAAASADSYVRLWKVSNQDMKGKPVHVPILSERKVDTFFFSPDSRLLGICASGSAQVWDIKSGKLVWEHSDDTDRSSKIFAFSPDSKEIAGVDGSNLYISKLDSKPRALGPRKQSHYLTAAFSEEELLMAVAHDAGLQLWLINESWKLLHEVPLQPDSYHGLSFSSDGVDLAYGQLCWEVDSFPDVRYTGKAPPKSFIKDNKESNEKPRGHSFLTYKDGWIHSAFPRGPLLPIPGQFRDDSRWSAYGNSVILWNDFGEPIMIDCTSLLE